jgi:hypothetical protein
VHSELSNQDIQLDNKEEPNSSVFTDHDIGMYTVHWRPEDEGNMAIPYLNGKSLL